MKRFFLAVVLVGCGGKDLDTDSGEHTHHHTDSCDDGEVDDYIAGIHRQGDAGFTVTIRAADPSPPDVGRNTWTLEVTDPSGAEVNEGGSVVVVPWMPLHGHGTTPPDYFGAANEDGTWTVPEVDLFMPGLWELTFEVADAAGTSDSVLFRFCLEG